MSDDFYSWKRHPITQIVMSELTARITQITEELINTAGQDSRTDTFRSGLIKAYRDLVNISLDDIGEESHGR